MNSLFPLPPLPEQRAIANFLDRKTAAIDELIRAKERLIELLQEKRQALITQAVTKGLDPNVPMKDSGIEWLGEVPSHWDVRKLKYACVLQRGFDLPQSERRDGQVPVIGGGGITGFHDTMAVSSPAVVTGRYGTVGEVHFITQPCWPLNTSLYVKEFWENSERYIAYLLSTVPLNAYSAKSAVPGVDRNDLHMIPVGVPPIHEQIAIGDRLIKTEIELGKVIAAHVAQVTRLAEYRQALISAAVTGQLDISAESPDEVPV